MERDATTRHVWRCGRTRNRTHADPRPTKPGGSTIDLEQSPASRRSNPFGVASLVAGVLMVIASIAVQTVVSLLPVIATELDFTYRTIPYLIFLRPAILATIAMALGVVGLLLCGRARVMAISGTTLGASHLIIGVAAMLGAAFLHPVAG